MITDPTETYFKDGTWGWDGTVWRKLPVLWGYSNVYGDYRSEDNVSAGGHTLTFGSVPDGEVWVVTNLCCFCTTANPTAVDMYCTVGGVLLYLAKVPYPTADVTVDWVGSVVLKKDDYVGVYFAGCSLNDDIRAYVAGYKMKIAE